MSSPDYEKQSGSIRLRYRYIGGTGDNAAYAEYMSLAPAIPLGHYEVTVGTSPVTLPSLPTACRRVVIQSINQDLTYTDDGSNPSSTHGIVIPEMVIFTYDTDPDANFKMWCPASSDVRIAYYG
jgi:hypothetical protein